MLSFASITMLNLPLVIFTLLLCDGGVAMVHAFIVGTTSAALNNNCAQTHYRFRLSLSLGDYTVELQKPLGIILQERDNSSGGVQVKELVDGGAAATHSSDIVPCDVLLQVNDMDVSTLDFDSVMDVLISLDETSLVELTLGDGLGQLDMPKNVVKQLKTTEDAFFIDAVVRKAVREIRKRNNILGDLINVEVIIGAGVQDEGKQGQARFFALFSTDGVSSYSCNVSATGRCRDDGSIDIVNLSAAKDEGLGQTYQFI